MPHDSNDLDGAVLVSLSIRRPPKTKKRKDLSRAYVLSHSADEVAATISSMLLPKDDEHIKAIDKAAGKARNLTYHLTEAYTDDGRRLLPTALLPRWQRELQEQEDIFWHHVQKLTDQQYYDDLKDHCEKLMGDLWDPRLFPSHHRLKSSFNWAKSAEPVPIAKHFALTLQQTTINKLKNDLATRNKAVAQKVTKNLFDRVLKVTSHMAEKLDDPKAIFRDSLVGNIKDLADILHDLNLAKDPKLDQLIPDLHALAAVKPDDLRKDTSLRMDVRDDAEELAEKVAEYAASFSQFAAR